MISDGALTTLRDWAEHAAEGDVRARAVRELLAEREERETQLSLFRLNVGAHVLRHHELLEALEPIVRWVESVDSSDLGKCYHDNRALGVANAIYGGSAIYMHHLRAVAKLVRGSKRNPGSVLTTHESEKIENSGDRAVDTPAPGG